MSFNFDRFVFCKPIYLFNVVEKVYFFLENFLIVLYKISSQLTNGDGKANIRNNPSNITELHIETRTE